MKKTPAFLAALFCAGFVTRTFGAVPALDLHFATPETVSADAGRVPAIAPKIVATAPPVFTPRNDFLVGKDIRLTISPLAGTDWHFRPALSLREPWDFLRRQTAGPSDFERLVDRFDVEEVDEPWATTTTVRLLAATQGWFVPFASFAHEQDINENFDRYGIGCGAMMLLGKNVTLGAELMYFAGDSSATSDAFGNETLFLTRLQFEF